MVQRTIVVGEYEDEVRIIRKKQEKLEETLVSFIYDLAKEVPLGNLNRILLNTIVEDTVGPIHYTDKDLLSWVKVFVGQLVSYQTKYTKKELKSMGFDITIPCCPPNLEPHFGEIWYYKESTLAQVVVTCVF